MKKPFDEILDAVDLPPGLVELLPRKWEKIGDVLLLKLSGELMPHKDQIAEAYSSVLRTKAVLRDMGISGRFREPDVELLLGDETETRHRENGVSFMLDPSRLMFSSGNIDERIRMAELPSDGDHVVDMFAGIGYFILPMAVHSSITGLAFELNPVSHGYLERNIGANDLRGRIEAVNADCMTAPEGVADRVIMGYLWDTEIYLRKAFRIIGPDGGTVHCHTICPVDMIPGKIEALVERTADSEGLEASIDLIREVKSYSPGVDHMVVDIVIQPEN